MGEALLSGILRAGAPPEGVIAAVRRDERAQAIRKAYGVETATAVAAAQRAETLILAVKPQDMAALLEEIAPVIPAGWWSRSRPASPRRSSRRGCPKGCRWSG